MPIIGVIASSMKGAPAAPTSVSATDVGTGRAYNNGAATVSFTPGAGATATSFTATSSPGGFTATGASSPLTVQGLQSGVSYTFTVTATNASGTSPASAASNSITATTVPQAPTIGTATATGQTTATVAFTAGATGGKAVSTYTATSSPSSITGTNSASPITVSGLTSGTSYTFTVTATNANGTSTASAASNSITTLTPGDYYQLATANVSGVGIYTFSGIPSTYKYLEIRYALSKTSTDSIGQGYYYINDVRTNDYSGGHWYAEATSGGTVNQSTSLATSESFNTFMRNDPVVNTGVMSIAGVTSASDKVGIGYWGTAVNANFETYVGWTAGMLRTSSTMSNITFRTLSGTWGNLSTISIYGVV